MLSMNQYKHPLYHRTVALLHSYVFIKLVISKLGMYPMLNNAWIGFNFKGYVSQSIVNATL